MILFDIIKTGPLPEIPRISTALEFLRSCNPGIQDGTVELNGKQMFAVIQSYNTKQELDAPRFEAHREYIDIQFLLSGSEIMGWAPLGALTVTEPYDKEKDILFGTAPKDDCAFTSFGPGHAIVLFPSDAHAPGLAEDAPAPVRKVVVKIRL